MGKLNDLTIRHNSFVQNMNIHIAASINEQSRKLLTMNKSQMFSHKDSKDKPLIHKLTNSPLLSKGYALLTNKSRPNLFRSGDFQNAMFLDVNENNLTYSIDSEDNKAGILTENYGNDIFGIPEKFQINAKQLTGERFKVRYKKLVLRK